MFTVFEANIGFLPGDTGSLISTQDTGKEFDELQEARDWIMEQEDPGDYMISGPIHEPLGYPTQWYD